MSETLLTDLGQFLPAERADAVQVATERAVARSALGGEDFGELSRAARRREHTRRRL